MTAKSKAKTAKRFGYLELVLTALAAGVIGFYLGAMVIDAYRSGQPGTGKETISIGTGQPDEFAAEKARIRVLEDATQADPGQYGAWVELGNLCFDTHQYEKAVAAYEAALKLNGSSPDVWTDLGIMYRETGRFQKALEAFDKAIALNPGHDNARFNKGVVLLHDIKDREAALAAWEALVKVNPLAQTPEGGLVRDAINQVRNGR
ncbi:MAG TPA: tetratricopeptide repeat protein [Desulfovibrio sp.]|uniref:tetratricopeptide repeat protein n=1 Tax=Desulfovibrio sp. TaxID=885 RepID=UPI002CD4AF5C|nr:tetratricopeptide repeat protein [Desulfovibrio sp.]HMM37539.1 tetratricopeptide repeat protein [Desulfovibrio sp.]